MSLKSLFAKVAFGLLFWFLLFVLSNFFGFDIVSNNAKAADIPMSYTTASLNYIAEDVVASDDLLAVPVQMTIDNKVLAGSLAFTPSFKECGMSFKFDKGSR